ncbi:MAG: zinc ribbon domain-containing protein [Steroidobacteraceae bacterium]
MIRKWNVDDHTLVEARTGMLGKTALSANGKALDVKFWARKKTERQFELPDGRCASISVVPQLGMRPALLLSVDGRLMVETGKKPIKCEACGAIVKPNDRFCTGCGQAMPTAETVLHRTNLKKATRAITWLAVLFLVSGLLMYYLANQRADTALSHLAGMDASAVFPKPIEGHSYTVGELRKQITWEPRSILLVNSILAAVMAGLAVWGRRAPLPAILIATATYVVVTVTNAIIEPTTIGQGIYVKIVVVALLVRGIKAALALRSAEA